MTHGEKPAVHLSKNRQPKSVLRRPEVIFIQTYYCQWHQPKEQKCMLSLCMGQIPLDYCENGSVFRLLKTTLCISLFPLNYHEMNTKNLNICFMFSQHYGTLWETHQNINVLKSVRADYTVPSHKKIIFYYDWGHHLRKKCFTLKALFFFATWR